MLIVCEKGHAAHLGSKAVHQLSDHSIGATAASHVQLQRPLISVQDGQSAAWHLRDQSVSALHSSVHLGNGNGAKMHEIVCAEAHPGSDVLARVFERFADLSH